MYPSLVRLSRAGQRMMARSAAVLSFAIVPAAAIAQTQDATLTGRVSDAESNEPISGARVFVPGTVMSATTRLDGTYRLRLSPGTHEVRVTYIGYGLTRDSIQADAGASMTRDFQLNREALALEELAEARRRSARSPPRAPSLLRGRAGRVRPRCSRA